MGLTAKREGLSVASWIRIGLLLLALLSFLYLLFPRAKRFQYEFQKGKVWTYATLDAPYDFPLYYTPQEVTDRQATLLGEQRAYYRLDSSVAGQVYRRVQRAVLELQPAAGPNIPSADTIGMVIRPVLRSYYRRGVIAREELLRHVENLEFSILRGRQSYVTQINDVYTPGEVALKVHDTLQALLGDGFGEIPDSLYLGNLRYDSVLSAQMQEDQLRLATRAEGMVRAGTRIIAQGEVVNEASYRKLSSLAHEYELRGQSGGNRAVSELANALMLVAFIVVYLAFLYTRRREVLLRVRSFLFLLASVGVTVGVAYLVIRLDTRFLYLVPYLSAALLVQTFFDSRLAFATHLLIVLLVAMSASNGFEFVLLNLSAGCVALYTSHNVYRRAGVFLAACYLFLGYTGTLLLFTLVRDGDLLQLNYMQLLLLGGNAFLTLAVQPVMYPLERVFGFLSNATLLELADINQPLLRRLAEQAPGTFQHSMQVSNLAESGVLAIGGNPLLVRVGALYHDLGKMEGPEFFTENQEGGVNPHRQLDELDSARIIIAHVGDGLKIAKAHGLPALIQDFISTHHGTTRTEYFYRTWQSKNPDAQPDPAPFTYPGPRPKTRETAVLMMADGIEAASRSLNPINEETLTQLVDKLVGHQQQMEQFDDCDITYRQIRDVKRVFVQKLLNIYHSRIAYPADPKG